MLKPDFLEGRATSYAIDNRLCGLALVYIENAVGKTICRAFLSTNGEAVVVAFADGTYLAIEPIQDDGNVKICLGRLKVQGLVDDFTGGDAVESGLISEAELAGYFLEKEAEAEAQQVRRVNREKAEYERLKKIYG